MVRLVMQSRLKLPYIVRRFIKLLRLFFDFLIYVHIYNFLHVDKIIMFTLIGKLRKDIHFFFGFVDFLLDFFT